MLTEVRSGADGVDPTTWDTDLQRFDGDLLQSWRWGEFKRRHGWRTERIRRSGPGGVAMGQMLFRPYGPVSLAYVPRGPILSADAATTSEFLAAMDAACARRRAVMVVIEPSAPLPPDWTSPSSGFVTGPDPFQTSSTVKVHLADDHELLAGMRKDTRSNVLQARRRGVSVERVPASPDALDTFYRLLRETSHRSGFGIHRRAYYQDFLHVFGERAVLLFSRAEGQVTAGLIAAHAGAEGRSMYAGSSGAHRGRGDTALLRLEAMSWAREHGCTRYDLGGIATGAASGTADGDGVIGGRGADLTGVRQFKTGFGGEVVAYPRTIERRYRPTMAWLLRRLSPRYRGASQGQGTTGLLLGPSLPIV